MLSAACGDQVDAATRAAALPVSAWEDLDPDHPGHRVRDPRSGIVFRRIEPGEFSMGSDLPGESPRHQVRLTRAYLMAETEVAAATWRRYAAERGVVDDRSTGGDQHPVGTSWHESQRYCEFYGYRLPTEAEWEYACLGGRPPDAAEFHDVAAMEAVAWFHVNAGDGTRAVATRRGNPYGLHDMLGNVWEWCADWHAADYRGREDGEVDPGGPALGLARVLRGGSWFTVPAARPQSRTLGDPDERNDFYGFRPVVDLPE